MKAIELKGISKHFGKTLANDNIDFDLNQGEIHAILGENGAGKSTLMNIMSGLVQPDKGRIILKDKEVCFKSPKDAIKDGIGMVHQHFNLIPSQSVLENIILGTKLPFILRRKNLAQSILEIFRLIDQSIDLNDRISDLSIGKQQQVEIVRALYRKAQILILDEPTAVLTPQETNRLFHILKSMKNDGYSIVFISHKLGEVMSIADRISILRKGSLIDTIYKSEGIDIGKISNLMLGYDFSTDINTSNNQYGNEVALRMDNVSLLRSQRSQSKTLDNVSLEIHDREIFGIAGVSGNGQLELSEVVVGLKKEDSGMIYIAGKDISKSHIREIIGLGVAYIPEDRIGVGTIQNLNLYDNAILRSYDLFSFFNKSKISSYTKRLADKFDIKYSDLSSPVSHLSGGNLQKLIIARELNAIPKLIVSAYPTRGLDIKSADFVRNMLLEYKNNGSAILLISENLDELMEISDRIGVLFNGKLSIMQEKDPQKIGLAMAGG